MSRRDVGMDGRGRANTVRPYVGAGLIAQAVGGGGGSRAPALRWRRPEARLEIAGVTPGPAGVAMTAIVGHP